MNGNGRQLYRVKKSVAAGDIALEQISEVLKEDDTFVWLGLLEPGEELLQKIKREFGLHELAIEDAHAAHQCPKLEEYGDSLFVVLHTPQVSDDTLQFGETHLFVGRWLLVSVRHGPSLSYRKVRERCERHPERLAHGPGFALYAIVDFVVDNYRSVLDSLRARFENLEEQIFQQRVSRCGDGLHVAAPAPEKSRLAVRVRLRFDVDRVRQIRMEFSACGHPRTQRGPISRRPANNARWRFCYF